LEVTKTVLSLMLVVVITILTALTLTTTIAAVYAGGDDNNNGDGNKQKAEDDSAAAIADCDDNDVEEARFLCIALATNDVEIETPSEEERATLSVCKTEDIPNMSPEDFDFSILEGGGVNSPPDADPVDFQGSADCVDIDIGPGEYVVSEETLPPEFGTSILEGSDCEQDEESQGIAVGFIEAGETQFCRYFNFVEDDS
jgi:hypothetical protein